MKNLFRLKNTYELLFDDPESIRPGQDRKVMAFRIDIFENSDNPQMLRARVWEQNTCHIWPILRNSPQFSEGSYRLDDMYSLVQFLDASSVRGKEYADENELLDYIYGEIDRYRRTQNLQPV